MSDIRMCTRIASVADITTRETPRPCSLTLTIPDDARDAGYRGRCPECGRFFLDAVDWARAVCQPRAVA